MVVASVLSLTFSGMVFSRVTLSDCDMQSTDGSKYSVSYKILLRVGHTLQYWLLSDAAV